MKTDLPVRLRATSDNLDPKGNYWVCPILQEAALEISAFHAIAEDQRLEIERLKFDNRRLASSLKECQRFNLGQLGITKNVPVSEAPAEPGTNDDGVSSSTSQPSETPPS